MDKLLQRFKDITIQNFNRKDFKYHEWFVTDHLIIVERLAGELCDLYPEADRDLVIALVWFHDFGKPLDGSNERELTRSEGSTSMNEIGFSQEFIEKTLSYWELMEQKETIDISAQPIEVQIVSSADGGSHFIGKFYSSYFRDDPNEDLKSIVARIKKKIHKDWERKIVLPEMKKAFRSRYLRALEITGEYPDKFI